MHLFYYKKKPYRNYSTLEAAKAGKPLRLGRSISGNSHEKLKRLSFCLVTLTFA